MGRGIYGQVVGRESLSNEIAAVIEDACYALSVEKVDRNLLHVRSSCRREVTAHCRERAFHTTQSFDALYTRTQSLIIH